MPTFFRLAKFIADLEHLTDGDRERFKQCVLERFVPDLEAGKFRPGLRVSGVQGHPGVWEMTWAPDGRATFQYGKEIHEGAAHIEWRRVGTHDIFDRP